MTNTLVVRPAATSWPAVLGGWIASVGAMALAAPAIGTLLAGSGGGANDIAPAVPVILGLFVAYLVGGYVAGRMAGYRTSWHGMMSAFFGLFVVLVLTLIGYAADRGLFAAAGVRSLADLAPGASGIDVATFGDAVTFGSLLGFPASIFAGWLGGVLAPSHAVVAIATPTPASPPVVDRSTTRRVETREVVREPGPLVPAAIVGRKGGERVDEREHRR